LLFEDGGELLPGLGKVFGMELVAEELFVALAPALVVANVVLEEVHAPQALNMQVAALSLEDVLAPSKVFKCPCLWPMGKPMARDVTACEGLHLSWQTSEQAVREDRLGRAQSRELLGAAKQVPLSLG
jgi:hypothetical protein